MHISESISYDAPPADILALVADPTFAQLVADRSRPLRSTVEAGRTDDSGAYSIVERTQAADGLGLPSAIKLDELTLVQEQRWSAPGPDGVAHGTVTVRVSGLPVTFTGTTTLRPEGDGATGTVDGELVAKVPLVGGKIEKAAAPAVLAAIRVEAQAARERLAGR